MAGAQEYAKFTWEDPLLLDDLLTDDERLVIRHDAGSSAAPYVAGTLLAARRVLSFVGLKRGLDAVMD